MLYYDRMIELMFLKELILVKQVPQKSVIFVTTGIFKIKGLNLKHMYAIHVMFTVRKLSMKNSSNNT